LKKCGGRVIEAAETLGVSRRALYLNLEKLGIDPDDFRSRPRKGA
jgi:DNA-binding NtrC family response regulator